MSRGSAHRCICDQALNRASGEVTSANAKAFTEAKRAPTNDATLVVVMGYLQSFSFKGDGGSSHRHEH